MPDVFFGYIKKEEQNKKKWHKMELYGLDSVDLVVSYTIQFIFITKKCKFSKITNIHLQLPTDIDWLTVTLRKTLREENGVILRVNPLWLSQGRKLLLQCSLGKLPQQVKPLNHVCFAFVQTPLVMPQQALYGIYLLGCYWWGVARSGIWVYKKKTFLSHWEKWSSSFLPYNIQQIYT